MGCEVAHGLVPLPPASCRIVHGAIRHPICSTLTRLSSLRLCLEILFMLYLFLLILHVSTQPRFLGGGSLSWGLYRFPRAVLSLGALQASFYL